MLLTNTQLLKPCKAFTNNSSANMKLSKTQLHKIGQSGGFLGKPLGPPLKTGLLLMKKKIKSLTISALIPLGLTVAVSATGAAIHENMFQSGVTTLIISNEEMNDIPKIVKSLEESGLLIKELKQQKGGFLMLLGTLDANLLENL